MARILLVEDESWLGELYTQLLAGEHDVIWRRDVYDAMEAIEQTQIDVIILDIMLPWANGIQLLHELVSHSDTASIPVILFSAVWPEQLDEEALRAYGVVATLDKTSVKPHHVIEVINGVVRAYANISD